MEGPDLSAMSKTWQDLAASEMRLHLMTELGKIKVGFAEVEEFSLGLNSKLRSTTSEIHEGKVVKAAMEIKMRDEKRYNNNLIKRRNQHRRDLGKHLGQNTKKYRTVIRNLRGDAQKIKSFYKEKYEKKLEHLRNKYRESEEEKVDKIPSEIEEYSSLSIFDRGKFCRIEIQLYDITIVGEVYLSEAEISVLRLHPKFSVIELLSEGGLDFEQELAYAKLRMTINKELEEKVEGEEEIEITEEEQEMQDEIEAKSRQTFDPEKKEYDDRKRRVTDLKECSRVTLPKPLPTKEEALIEMRREMHGKIYEEFRQENCNKDGEQQPNLSEIEREGLKSLQKRIKEGEIVIMKTDKSNKFCVATREEYIKMGEIHTKNDKKITREEIHEIEKQLNGHSVAWVKMWGTGADNGHQDRVIDSKTTKSNNLASMYIAYKDHKKEKRKTRPIVTGCTSNTRGLSNSVSNLLESVANSVLDPFESISSEDMLSKTKRSNEETAKIRDAWNKKRLEKLRCNICNIEEIKTQTCQNCKENEIQEEDLTRQYDCETCGEELREKLEQDCTSCGGGLFLEDKEMCLLGLDVVALFPSMKSKNTGIIIRRQIQKSPLKIRGFDWRQGTRYIVMNKQYTGDLSRIWKLLPYRRKVGGTAPGMKSKELNSKKGNIESQWAFPPTEPTEEQEREIVARVAEIGVRVLFENFTYKFAGAAYQQSSGGPIGARVTMAAARIVMQQWGENYRIMLEVAKVEITLLTGYVDDVRQQSNCLRMGTRFDDKNKRFVWSEAAKKEDMARKKEMQENSNSRMVRVCLPAINSVNRDLEFTAEIPEDFQGSKLPTLDFFLWLMKSGALNHSYFEKSMKTPYVIMRRSAMSEHQRYSILANELVRRLSNINHTEIEIEEQLTIIENFIMQMKTSQYDRKQIKEAVVSGILGWKRKISRREKEGKPFYRSAESTLKLRCTRRDKNKMIVRTE